MSEDVAVGSIDSDRYTRISTQEHVPEPYRQRFERVTDDVFEFPIIGEWLIRDEIESVEKHSYSNIDDEETVRYLALLEVLHDLIELGLRITKGSDVTVYRPEVDDPQENPTAYKSRERSRLQKERRDQFRSESGIRKFIHQMERVSGEHTKEKPIQSLMVQGSDLYDDLAPLMDLERDEVTKELEDLIQPYLQVAERGVRDEYTGMDLHRIWRYFRHSWLNPYNTAVGRNINFLIRDAARKNHPVIGIATLANSMMNLGVRDDEIGWTRESLKNQLNRKRREVEYEEQLPEEQRTNNRTTITRTDTIYLESKDEYEERVEELCEGVKQAIDQALRESISTIRYDDFIEEYPSLTEEKILSNDPAVHDVLRKIEGQAEYVLNGRPDLADADFDPDSYGLTDGGFEGLNFEDIDPENCETWEERSETALFRAKRARTLSQLIRSRRILAEHEATLSSDATPRDFIESALENRETSNALRNALKENKKRRVGSCMMNIMVCGAIPPYNDILGGKLVAMALTGPETIASYKEIYGDQVSEIASGMKGEEVQKPTELVFLDTTGLFEKGSAQYDRIRIPADNGEIRYEEIGTTDGVGTVQFGATTRKWLSTVTRVDEGRRVVRGRFGEGVSPRLRKIRQGLTKCGLSGDLLKHNSRRVIYSVDLAENAKPFLRAESEEPQYYWNFDDIGSKQQSIYTFWKDRWVSKRIQKEWILDSIRDFDRNEFLLSNHFEDRYNEKFSSYQE